MLPLPEGIFNLITLPLQNYATSATTSALHLLQIPTFHEGHLVHLPQLTLSVTETYSGIRSFLTLLTGPQS